MILLLLLVKKLTLVDQSFDTDDVSEGSSNLYFTDARAQAAISVTDAGGDGSLSYDNSTGVITYTGPSAAEVRAHLSAGYMLDYDSSTGEMQIMDSDFSASWDDVLAIKDTADLAEGSNLYFTEARARASISGVDFVDYDSSNGVIDIDRAAFTASVQAAAATGLSEDAFILTYDSGSSLLSVDAANMSSSVQSILADASSADEVRGHLSAGYMIDFASGEFAIDAAEFSASWDAAMAADNTDSLTEGSSNLYYLDSRARAAISVSDAGGDGSLSYDSSTGVISYTGPSAAEVRAHLSAGNMLDYSGGQFSVVAADFTASADAAWDVKMAAADTGDLAEGSNLYYTEARWDAKMAAADTDDLSEGASNLYFTDARARAAVSVVDNSSAGRGELSYNSTTGVLTYEGISQSEVRGDISGGTGVTYNAASGVIAIGQAVETTSDVQFASGSFSGDVTIDGDLTVSGGTVTLDVTNLSVEDRMIQLNRGAALGGESGLQFNNDGGDDIFFQWDQPDGQFQLIDAQGAFQDIRVGTMIGDLQGVLIESIQTIAADASESADGSTVILIAHNATVTLPAAADVEGVVLKIKNYDRLASASEPAVIAAASGEFIEGGASISLPSPGAAVMVISDGSDWHVM
jgi:hypothetical protein